MKKCLETSEKLSLVFILFFVVILFFGCAQQGGDLSFEKTKFYKIEDEISGSASYFQYPQNAMISLEDGVGFVEYDGCKVNIGAVPTGLYEDSEVTVRTKNDNGRLFRTAFKDDSMIFYSGVLSGSAFIFWIFDYSKNVSDCSSLVDSLAYSFTDKPIYYNDEFSFKADLLPDFKVESLPSGDGVLMKKWMQELDKDGNMVGYKVEISVFATKNLMRYSDIKALLTEKYPGYSMEFADFNGKTAVYINEEIEREATRHFFVFSDNSDVIYEAYLKVPSLHYSAYQDVFAGFVSTIEIF